MKCSQLVCKVYVLYKFQVNFISKASGHSRIPGEILFTVCYLPTFILSLIWLKTEVKFKVLIFYLGGPLYRTYSCTICG